MTPSPLIAKVAAVAAIGGLLMLALGRVGELADERQARFREAERSVEHSQAGRQALLGPVLLSHCVEEWETTVGEGKDRKTQLDKREFMLSATPRQLAMQATATMEPRYRGLFKVNTYAVRATLQAQWAPPAALRPQRKHAGSTLQCGAPVVMVAVSDARGIRHASIRLGGDALAVRSGTLHASHPRGFHAALPEALRGGDATLALEVALELVGTSELAVAPVADDTRVTLDANWPHPSFGGRFLPLTREVRAEGFSATWQLSSLATTAGGDFQRGSALCSPNGSALPADGVGNPAYGGDHRVATTTNDAAGTAPGCIESFSVGFIDPVNPYSLSDRAVKYGLLFIALTFVAVGVVEVLRQLRVHPVQYLLVGAALSIFFLLLLSLSEHLSFDLSYLIAAGACVALLGAYGRHLLRSRRAGALFGASVAALYGVLYALLQMEQSALVMGSVLLFAVLAGVMMLTRRLDWYRVLGGAAPRGLQPDRPAAQG